jgi:hypothetical protein
VNQLAWRGSIATAPSWRWRSASEEGLRCGGIKRQAGRQLHEQAAELAAQAGDLRQEAVQQAFAIAQALFVGDGFGQFGGKRKSAGTLSAQRA